MAALLRAAADYDLCDSLMIADCCLYGKSTVLFVDSTVIPADIVPALEGFIARNGRIVQTFDASVSVVESGAALEKLLPEGVECIPEYERLRRAENEFITIHKRHVSRYSPDGKDFTIESR